MPIDDALSNISGTVSKTEDVEFEKLLPVDVCLKTYDVFSKYFQYSKTLNSISSGKCKDLELNYALEIQTSLEEFRYPEAIDFYKTFSDELSNLRKEVERWNNLTNFKSNEYIELKNSNSETPMSMRFWLLNCLEKSTNKINKEQIFQAVYSYDLTSNTIILETELRRFNNIIIDLYKTSNLFNYILLGRALYDVTKNIGNNFYHRNEINDAVTSIKSYHDRTETYDNLNKLIVNFTPVVIPSAQIVKKPQKTAYDRFKSFFIRKNI